MDAGSRATVSRIKLIPAETGQKCGTGLPCGSTRSETMIFAAFHLFALPLETGVERRGRKDNPVINTRRATDAWRSRGKAGKKGEEEKKRDFRVHLDSRANGSCDSPAFTVLGAPQGALRHREFTGDERRGFWSSFFIAAVIQDIARRMGMRAATIGSVDTPGCYIGKEICFIFFYFPFFSLSLFRRRIYVPRCSTETSRKLRLRDFCRVCGFSFWRFLRSLCLFFFFLVLVLFWGDLLLSEREKLSCKSLEIFSKSLRFFFFSFQEIRAP